MRQTNVKIAWLSDIHLREIYGTPECSVAKERAKILFDDLVMELIQHPLDYIILSGDIGFSGSKAEYALFEELFLQPLFAAYSENNKPKIITIPGNHDISWSQDMQFKKYLLTFTKEEGSFKERKKFMSETPMMKLFNESFSPYSTYFSSLKEPMQQAFFKYPNLTDPLTPCFTDSEYDAKRLFGFLVDYDKEVIFVMLNTAWFSIGDNFNKLLVKEDPRSLISEIRSSAQENSHDEFKEKVVKLLDVKSRIVEFGNQVTNAEGFPLDPLLSIILDNPKFTVVTVMHHPPSWLSWNEMYTYTGTHPELLILLKVSDILLTGHEHVPINKEAENDKLGFYHLKAGMLMEDDIRQKDYFQHSRFSILDLVNARNECSYTEHKFLYDKNARDSRWKKQLSDHQVVNYRQHRLSLGRKMRIIKNFSSFKVKAFLERKLGRSHDLLEIPLPPGRKCFTNCTVQLYKDKDEIRVVLLVQEGLNFFGSPFTKESPPILVEGVIELVDMVAKLMPGDTIKVHFIFLDLLIPDNNNIFPYPTIDKFNLTDFSKIPEVNGPTTEEVYSNIVRYSEQVFNNFRNLFFSSFEKEASELVKKKNLAADVSAFAKKFETIAKIKFIIDVLSYWDFERQCKR